MNINLTVSKVVVFRDKHGTDKIYIYTNLPSPFPPGVSNDNLVIQADAMRGSGEEYVRNNFGIEPEVLDLSKRG